MTAPHAAALSGSATPRRILVVGAGAANLKSTLALNLAAAASAAGTPVLLLDRDGASSRALLAAGLPAPSVPPASGPGRANEPGAVRLPWARAAVHPVPPDGVAPVAAPGTLVVVDPAPRLDLSLRAELAAATDVLVPVDASAIARRVLREVVDALAALPAAGGAPARVRVVLARLLPRTVDRWALVDEIEGAAPGALLAASLPMARRAAGTRRPGRPAEALLYAPGTAAARAYAALARELVGSDGAVVPDPGAPTAARASGLSTSA